MKKWLGLFFLTGCMVGPNYQTPDIAMPDQFIEGSAPLSDEDLVGWWKQFNDCALNELIEEAVQGNYDYRIALEQIAAARAQVQIKGSYLFPTIDATATAIRQRFSQNLFTTASNAEAFASGSANSGIGAVVGPPVQNFFQVGFDAVWELDVWGQYRRAKRAAVDQWEASQFIADTVLLSTIAETARDYISIRSYQQQIDLLKRKIAAQERELVLIETLLDAGLDSEIDLQTQVASLEADRAQLPVVETALKQMIYALATLLGKPPEALAHRFDAPAPLPVFLGKIPAGLPSALLRRRPDIRASERQLAAATEQIGIAIAGLFPGISLTGNSYGYESNRASKLFEHKSSIWSVGPSLNWDLIDFGRTRGQIDAAKAEQRQALLSYEQTVINALQDVEGALVAYFEEQKRTLDLSAAVFADARAYDLNQDLFQAGLASEIAQLDALKTLLTAEFSLIQSEQALASDLISLYKALGGNWECSSMP